MNAASRHLDLLAAANLLASGFHFADNTLRFPRFPEPSWISGPHVVVALLAALILLLCTPAILRGMRTRPSRPTA